MKNLMSHLKNYFIPHVGNDHKPHSLRRKSVLAIFLVIIVIELGFLGQVFVVFDKTKFLASVLPGVLTVLTNDERAQNGAPPLVENKLLDQAAQAKADDMVKNGYFAHTSPEGKNPWYWFDQVGYKYTYAGENLAVNFFESSDVAQAWMNSPTHRANIVKKDYTEIGIGVANGFYEGRSTVFVAQLFGTPLLTAITPSPITPIQTITPVKPIVIQKVVPTKSTPATTVVVVPTATTVLGEATTGTAPTISQNIDSTPKINLLQKILTSPKSSVTFMYLMIGLFVLLALSLKIFIKSEIRHPLIIARGVSLIAVIGVLSFINLRVLDVKTQIPSNITANVISSTAVILR